MKQMNTNRMDFFDRLVNKKFNLYNSMFLGLPFPNIKDTGTLIPLLQMDCQKGLGQQKDPKIIIKEFFDKHTEFQKEEEKFDFLFRVIQYVERQVVLFDAVEDASFEKVNALNTNPSVAEICKKEFREGNLQTVIEKLNTFGVRLVFTAHPTQFYPLTVLDIINALRNAIQKDEIEEIDIQLQQLGLTSFIQKQKPTPFQEAQNIMYYLRNVYYDAIGAYYQELYEGINSTEFENHEILRIGFWPGGDRDGNPFVTAETTQKVAAELRSSLMRSYYSDVRDLEKKLSFSKTYPIIKNLRERLYQSIFHTEISVAYAHILQDIKQLKSYLQSDYNNLYINELELFENKVSLFKNHFASLDIRQNHEVHEAMINQLLKSQNLITKNYTELSTQELEKALFEHDWNLEGFTFEEDAQDVMQETFQNIKQIAELQKMGGEQACNRYIISNSEDTHAVLFVLALFNIQGYNISQLPMDIIPLFETMKGMENSEQIMTDLYENPYYKKHIAYRNHHQTIMLGFSDGTKDGGYLKANWNIFKTKENLSQLSEAKGITVLFFDGRGGPPARGGGKTQRFYASQSDRIANHDIELTIQGQTITSTYGTSAQFLYNCDQMLSAGLRNHLSQEQRSISNTHRVLMEELSEKSFDTYEKLKLHPKFIPYLEQRSTLQYYGKANIGSRPGKRGKSKKLTLKDLRAISFVGAWSQLKQNVPGYFGIGTALESIKKEQGIEVLHSLWNEVAFFRALMKNSMMSLEKSDFNLTKYLSEDEEFKDFWNILFSEYERTHKMLLEISSYEELMEEEPLTKASIQKREEIVLPLLVIQQFALQMSQLNDSNKKVYDKLVIRSLYGNINASRNSA